MQTRQLPNSVESETALLGSLLIDPQAVIDVCDLVNASAFFQERNGWIYQAIIDLHTETEPIDFLTVQERLRLQTKLEKVGGEGYLIDLLTSVPTSVNATAYARIVAEMATRRKMIRSAGKIATWAYATDEKIDSVIAQSETELFAIRNEQVTRYLHKPKEYAGGWLDRFEKRQSGETTPGLSSGFPALDNLTGGFVAPFAYVLAGRPGMGKSAIALAIALNIALSGGCVVFFSAEMSLDQMINRAVSRMTGIDSTKIQRGQVHERDMGRVHKAVQTLHDSQLIIDTSPGMTPSMISAVTLRVAAQQKIDLVVVDHLHELTPDVERQREDLTLADSMRTLMTATRRVNCPMLLLAQLSRKVEERANKRPMNSDLRNSGEIEQKAHTTLFAYRDEYYNPETTETPNICEISIAKNRDGKTGRADLFWQGENVTVRNLERESHDLNL